MKRRADPAAPESIYLADDTDRGILRILQIDARRPFSAISRDLGLSDQTVARRYQQLRARAGVRVFALTQPNVNTQDLWVLRVRAGANLNNLATNLARRGDTAWVHLSCGPTGLEIVAMVYRERDEAPGFTLLEQLSALPSVVSVTAQSCLRMFFGGPESLLTKSSSSSDSPVLQDRSTVNGEHRRLDPRDLTDADHRLLAALAVDGRASLKVLSQASGLAQETVTARLTLFEQSGILYFDVDFDAELLGLRTSVSMWATVDPARIEEAGRALATHNEISFATATTGTTNIYAVAHCIDAADLYRYLSGPLAELPGLRSVETAPYTRVLKMAQRDPAK